MGVQSLGAYESRKPTGKQQTTFFSINIKKILKGFVRLSGAYVVWHLIAIWRKKTIKSLKYVNKKNSKYTPILSFGIVCCTQFRNEKYFLAFGNWEFFLHLHFFCIWNFFLHLDFFSFAFGKKIKCMIFLCVDYLHR